MKISILSIFPGYFQNPINEGVIRIARDKRLLDVELIDIRDFTEDKHRQVDDYPYGGGAGMVMKAEPVFKAIESATGVLLHDDASKVRTVLLTPRGRIFDQKLAHELAEEAEMVLICGHYEGIDERVHLRVSDEVSVGDYVLSGGEPAALVVMDAVTRLIDGVLGSPDSLEEESFTGGLLEYPQYTRPAEIRGMRVPDVLLSGDHAKIALWRRGESVRRTNERRPDMIEAIEEKKVKGESKDD